MTSVIGTGARHAFGRMSLVPKLHQLRNPDKTSTGTAAFAVPMTPGEIATAGQMFLVGKLRAERVQRERQGDTTASALMPDVDGIPTKEALQAMYRVTRDKTIRDALIFFVYTALLVASTVGIFDVHTAFTSNEAARQRFSARETPGVYWKKTFSNIQQYDEIISWLNIAHDAFGNDAGRGPLLQSMFGEYSLFIIAIFHAGVLLLRNAGGFITNRYDGTQTNELDKMYIIGEQPYITCCVDSHVFVCVF
jgi:hypothetical protein